MAEARGRPIPCPQTGRHEKPSAYRGRRWLVRLVVPGLTLCVVVPVAAQGPPLALPLHDPAYILLEGLERSGCAPARVSAFRPYDIARVRSAVQRAASDPTCAPRLVAPLTARFGSDVDSKGAVPAGAAGTTAVSPLRDRIYNVGGSVTARVTALGRDEYRPLWRDLRPKAQGDPPVVGIARVRGRYAPTPRTVGVIEAYAQSHSRNDPLVRARQLRSTSGVVGITEATFSGAFGPISLSIGRDREAWFGDRTESLLLSAQGPPLDRVAASLSTTHFEARALYAMLDDVVLDTTRAELPSGTPAQRFHRSIAAHALTWRPSRALELSVGETILLSRGSRTIELGYANPLMPYVLTQNDAGREGGEVRDNLVVFGSVRTRFGRTQLTGELIVDDIQIDAADREVTPHQLGWRVEGRQGWASPLPGSVEVEYQRIDSYTYLRGLYTDVYQYIDRPLGSELGPDADRVEASIDIWPNAELRLSAGGAVWRRGAQRIERRPAVGAVGNAGQTFPSATVDRPLVQRALLANFTAEMTRLQFPIRATVEVARMERPNHIASASASYLRAHLSATYAFRYP